MFLSHFFGFRSRVSKVYSLCNFKHFFVVYNYTHTSHLYQKIVLLLIVKPMSFTLISILFFLWKKKKEVMPFYIHPSHYLVSCSFVLYTVSWKNQIFYVWLAFKITTIFLHFKIIIHFSWESYFYFLFFILW